MPVSKKSLMIGKPMGAMIILNYLHYWDVCVLLPLAFIEPQVGDISRAWMESLGTHLTLHHIMPKMNTTTHLVKTIHPLKSHGRIRNFK